MDLYETSGGTEGTTLLDTMPVVIVTNRGVSSGKLRKTPLMRVEHDGIYALVASQGGAPTHPHWYRNLVADPHVELQDGPVKSDRVAREVPGTSGRCGGIGPWRPIRHTPSTRSGPSGSSPCSSSSRSRLDGSGRPSPTPVGTQPGFRITRASR